MNEVQNTFVRILRIVPGVSEKKAINIVLAYDSLENFYKKFENLSEQDSIDKIANIELQIEKKKKKGKIG